MPGTFRIAAIFAACFCPGMLLGQSCADNLSDDPSDVSLTALVSCVKEVAAENADLRAKLRAIELTPVPKVTATEHHFNDVRQGAQIPGSSGAVMCALTRVDDDTRDGQCRVYKQNNLWLMQTGAGSGEQVCSAVCLFIR